MALRQQGKGGGSTYEILRRRDRVRTYSCFVSCVCTCLKVWITLLEDGINSEAINRVFSLSFYGDVEDIMQSQKCCESQ